MRKLKKAIAITLAATMVLGGSLTTFAAGETSGESVGTGTSEGHVDKKKTNVELPTIAEGASPFAYTMDPEGLVSGTDHAKYENAEFPTTGDTGVYFNNGKKGGNDADKENVVYANTSIALDAVNKSSHEIELTVKAEAVSKATDISLVAKDALTAATDASLYLGLIVNTETAVAITKDTAATKTVTINGTDTNFKIAAKTDKTGYEYRELTLAEYQALDGNSGKTQDDFDKTWAKASFKLEGSTTANKAITSTTTAPDVKVTWSWTDPSANTAPSITTTTYNNVNLGSAEGGDLAVQVNLGAGTLAATGIANVKRGNDALAANMYSFDSATKVLTLSRANVLQYWNMDSVTLTITFAGETASTPTTAEIILNKGAASTGD